MHIVIGIITAIAGLLWALNSLQQSGFSFSSLNPFHWRRRSQWRKKYAQSPLYLLDNPMDAAAVVLLGMAKLEGEISREHKSEILKIFSDEFNLDPNKAQDLFASCSFLLQSENNFVSNIGLVLAPSREKITAEQGHSIIELMKHIATIESPISPIQQELLEAVTKILKPQNLEQQKW